jgi:hypothetical protein
MRAGRLREEVWDLAQAGVLASAELLHLRDAGAQAAAAQEEISRLREVIIPLPPSLSGAGTNPACPAAAEGSMHRPRPGRGVFFAGKGQSGACMWTLSINARCNVFAAWFTCSL